MKDYVIFYTTPPHPQKIGFENGKYR